MNQAHPEISADLLKDALPGFLKMEVVAMPDFWAEYADNVRERLQAEDAPAPEGPYQMDAVDDIPPELKLKIAAAVNDELRGQLGWPCPCEEVDGFKLWRAGLGPCREELNQLASQ